MMKKVLLVCVLVVALAGSASALPNYIWNISCTDTNGANSGVAVNIGQFTPAGTAQQTYITSTSAYAAEVLYTGGLDGTMAKTGLLQKDFRAVGSNVYILQVWAGTDYGMSTFDVRVWASTAAATKPAEGWNLYKLYDPISQEWGKTKLNTTALMATSSGSASSPWFKGNLPSFKTGSPLGTGQGYILALEIPEPGSMVAMLSGLVGLVGFGIRRRR